MVSAKNINIISTTKFLLSKVIRNFQFIPWYLLSIKDLLYRY